MIFELGKSYIVDVTEKGIMPLMEFDEDRWVNKDCDDLDFLTDEEKVVIINGVLDKIRAEIEQEYKVESEHPYGQGLRLALEIIDKYRESEDK